MHEPARDLRDGICAYLQGGLGNQLFILMAAWAQAERLGCPLYIDTSRFLDRDPLEKPETPYAAEIVAMALPGELVGLDSPWLRNSPRRPAPIRRPGRRSAKLRVYRQPGFGYDPAIERIEPGTTILGYFQSPRFFERIAGRARDLVRAAAIEDRERAVADAITSDEVTVHLRRGDYLQTTTGQFHGIATVEYALRAVALMDRLLGSPSYRVFSDSPAVVERELAGNDRLAFARGVDDLGPLATLLTMSRSRGFIMSNSSFSWWAAWLMDEHHDSFVVAPRPWFASGESASDLLLPHWITLDAR